ncbi:MAG: ABC transporter permease [bacterium]|nr:ABC transporter permease [bacterium]
MSLFVNVRIALSNMGANKLRTALTLLGVIIGVSAVVIVGAIGMSGRDAILDELETLGLRSVFVWRPWWKEEDPNRFDRSGEAITLDDLEAIKGKCQKITRIAPVNESPIAWAHYKGKYCRVQIKATTPSYKEIRNEEITSGRFLCQQDIDTRRRVCVVGAEIAERLFDKGTEPVGEEIYITKRWGKSRKYTIVGVLKRKDTPLLARVSGQVMEHNRRLIIPISVLQKELNSKEVWLIAAQATSSDVANEAAEEIKEILKRRHKGKFNYESETMQQHIETTNTILGTVGWIAVISAIISLLVGGIGIMNIMVSSVVERTREIGIRKSLGARNRDIFLQFLTEAVVISLIGGMFGCGLGIAATLIIEAVSSMPNLLSTYFITLGLFVSILVGILSGLYPALRAASLDPVEALRYE